MVKPKPLTKLHMGRKMPFHVSQCFPLCFWDIEVIRHLCGSFFCLLCTSPPLVSEKVSVGVKASEDLFKKRLHLLSSAPESWVSFCCCVAVRDETCHVKITHTESWTTAEYLNFPIMVHWRLSSEHIADTHKALKMQQSCKPQQKIASNWEEAWGNKELEWEVHRARGRHHSCVWVCVLSCQRVW